MSCRKKPTYESVKDPCECLAGKNQLTNPLKTRVNVLQEEANIGTEETEAAYEETKQNVDLHLFLSTR